jgi:predicted RecB family nuclease
MNTRLISKSSFIRGHQCYKSLWLHLNQPEERDEISEFQQRIFDTGHSVGSYAQQLFPGGIDASRGEHEKIGEALAFTQELIKNGQSVIYEAAFSDGQTLCYMDILVKENGQWRAYEVKASTGVKNYQVMDVAFQYFVITRSGLQLADIYLVHINNQYVRRGEIDVQQLFTKVNMTQTILALQAKIPENLAALQRMLYAETAPDIAMGFQCTHPYGCDFIEFCRSVIDQEEGNRQQGVGNRNQEALDEFKDRLVYPLFFMDFETIFPPIPMHDESRPYQQIPFQWSVHRVENSEIAKWRNSENLQHFEYLGIPPADPRFAFIEELLTRLGNEGSILVWNQAFEKNRLKEIVRDFPQYREQIEEILERIVDLMVPFRRKHLSTPEMNGSYSLKAVLPALVPDLSYDDLEIQDGGTASETYLSLYYDGDSYSVAEKRENLLRYCALDTLSMVRILEKLKIQL